jgi:hypothetical protein
MLLPIDKTKCRLTADFNEPRPLTSNPKTHIHGSWDLGASTGTPIIAPENGYVFYFYATRENNTKPMIPVDLPFNIKNHPYFYDVYGAITVLMSEKYTHVLAHSYMNQLFNRNPLANQKKGFMSLFQDSSPKWKYIEQSADARFPTMLFHTGDKPISVTAGECIAYVGNAGFSTGAHLHWEIHNGRTWNDYKDRVDPAKFFPEVKL